MERYKSFEDFYPYYISEHDHKYTKLMHFIGTSISIYFLIKFIFMNIYLFWILFLALWAIVPLMIIKGRTDEAPKIKTSPEIKSKKKGWFN